MTAIPLGALRLVVGALLLVFGLQWLRKAMLRASGHKDLHDEEAIFAAELAAAARRRHRPDGPCRDWYAFTLSFKGVLLEGLEVVFIVLTFGSQPARRPARRARAALAVVLVAAVGVAIRAPLARVPENTMKFVVGVMLTAFGVFWGAEGAGAHWPGSDAALLVLVPVVALYALGAGRGPAAATPRRPLAAGRPDGREPDMTDCRACGLRRVLVRLRGRRRLAGGARRRVAWRRPTAWPRPASRPGG